MIYTIFPKKATCINLDSLKYRRSLFATFYHNNYQNQRAATLVSSLHLLGETHVPFFS